MSFLAWLQSSPLAVWVVEAPTIWAYPTILMLHTLGLALTVGSSVVLALSALGFAPRLPFSALRRLGVPFWVGFAMNTASGLLLFIASAELNGTRALFYLKLGLIAAGVVVYSRLRRLVFTDAAMSHGILPPAARRLAVLSLALWLGAITSGRLMAYLI